MTRRLVVFVFALLGITTSVAAQPPDSTSPTSVPDRGVAIDSRVEFDNLSRSIVRVGSGYVIPANETAQDVVVVLGDVTVDGHVMRDVVVILGNATVSASAVIDGSLVVAGGTVKGMQGASIRRDLVVVGGALDAPANFAADGGHVVIGPPAVGGFINPMLPWLTQGLLWGRLIVPGLPWVWAVLAVVLVVTLLVNLIASGPVRAGANALSTRPLTAFACGVLVMLLAGPICLLLAVSVIGIAIVPFLVCALILAWIVGKVAVTRWIGMHVISEPQETEEASRFQSMRSVILGFAVIAVVYMIPILGMAVWTMAGVLGLGAATMVLLASYRIEHPPRPRVAPAASTAAPVVSPEPRSMTMQMQNPIEASASPLSSEQSGSQVPRVEAAAADITLFPRASFIERMAANLLDLILVAVVAEILDPMVRDNMILPLLLAYHIGFLAWKGTTVGGLICQLRVIRTDGTQLAFPDALVRNLTSLLSLVVLGLGFLWILRDPDRQAWHDKVAGTLVVKVPRNWPLR